MNAAASQDLPSTCTSSTTGVDYDGDSESVVPRNSSRINEDSSNSIDAVDPQTPVKQKKRSPAATVERSLGAEDDESDEMEDWKSSQKACNLKVVSDDITLCSNESLQVSSPTSSFTSSPTTATSSPTTISLAKRKSMNAVVQVSTLQASFAEKTASEMQEIIGWYSQYEEEERFTKIDQRQSLPNNAMIVDEYDDESDESDYEEDAASAEQASNNSSAATDGILSPTPSSRSSSSKRHRSPGSSKSHRAEQVREHLEEADHLIRFTQYMADVITELEHSSSSSSSSTTTSNGNDDDDDEAALELQKESLDAIVEIDAPPHHQAGRQDPNTKEGAAIQLVAEETAAQRPLRAEADDNNNSNVAPAVTPFRMVVLPIFAAIVLACLWSSSAPADFGGGQHPL
ncbi:MAG: hypothetical protein SGILL_001131 [Bacillariaceae sp.]